MLSHFSRVQRFMILWAAASQVPLFMEFPRQEYWSGLPRPPPEALPDPGIEPKSRMSPALASSFFTTSATWEASSTPTLDPKIELKAESLADTSK